MGEFTLARPHFEQCLTLYDPQQHRSLAFQYAQDPGMASLCHFALTLWLLGYPDQALEKIRNALALARALSHPHSLVYALTNAVDVHHFRREEPAAQEIAEEAMALATEHRFGLYIARGMFQQGQRCIAQGRVEEGLAMMHQGFVATRNAGTGFLIPVHLAGLALAYDSVGQLEKGWSTLNEALDLVHQTGGRKWEAELYRLQGELLLHADGGWRMAAWTPEECFMRALDIARRQQAKSWELRTATSLARLWQQQGKRGEAHALLAPIYGWFTEGFDTADLQEAKTLLEELG
jgi:predicted ATPase